MKLSKLDKINIDIPLELRKFLKDAIIYDSSSSKEAKTFFIDKGKGYFLKCQDKGGLTDEVILTKYLFSKGLCTRVVRFISEEKDWLLTKKIVGEDCISNKYLSNPTKLCDILSERLAYLHSLEGNDCPINHTERYYKIAEENILQNKVDYSQFPDNWGYNSPSEALDVIKNKKYLLETNTLLHGDYCLPNIILNDWKFSGFVDVGNGGLGDRHVDLFWGIWSLGYNLKTDKYKNRFIDGYGRDKVDEEMLRLVAAFEVFG